MESDISMEAFFLLMDKLHQFQHLVDLKCHIVHLLRDNQRAFETEETLLKFC